MTVKYVLTAVALSFTMSIFAQHISHPGLLLTHDGVDKIIAGRGHAAQFDKVVDRIISNADASISQGIVVPQPLDNGGGYSHEKHKDNYYAMYYCGIAYQLTKQTKYAAYVRDMLNKYAVMFPQLGPHPCNKPDQAGRLFFQPLNDCVWTCYTTMAYDYVYDWLTPKDRANYEKNIFRPMAEFISNGDEHNRKVFDSMHNHGTWENVAVGMIGHVIGDDDLIRKSLYGLHKDGNGGFMKQLDNMFSPDGYYTEGAYYQRYALWPFMVYAQILDRWHPGMHISQYRGGILVKAVRTLINMSYNDVLFRINDAVYQTINCIDAVNAVDACYLFDSSQKDLLDIASRQGNFVVSDAGYATAAAIADGQARRFTLGSCLLRDGADGSKGAVGILRCGEADKQTSLVLKATSHGQTHGHYDKLSMMLFDNGHEILQDYGSARFLNLEPRSGGAYTKENHTWALQTIAHNTVTVDSKSHFGGNFALSSQYASHLDYCDLSNPQCQVISASDTNAVPGVSMKRTLAMIGNKSDGLIILDIYRLRSNQKHQYDLPYYYLGTLSSTNFGMKRYAEQLPVLGKSDGYQHLWVEGKTTCDQGVAEFTWFNGDRFYSLNTIAEPDMQQMFVRMGANDPSMNIRNDAGYILRKPSADNYTFVSTIDFHGRYELVPELTADFKTAVKELKLVRDDDDYTAVRISKKDGSTMLFITRNHNAAPSPSNTTTADGKTYSWQGQYHLFME